MKINLIDFIIMGLLVLVAGLMLSSVLTFEKLMQTCAQETIESDSGFDTEE